MTIADSFRIGWWLVRLNRSQHWSPSRIKKYQTEALVRMLRHAVATVPYYRSLGLEPEHISSPDDLVKFPVISKRDIQNSGNQFLSSDYTKSTLHYSRTSGTSGEPTVTYYDRDCWLLSKYALKIRRLLDNGVGLLKRVVIVSEKSPDGLKNMQKPVGSGLLFDQRFLSIHDPVADHVALLNEIRVDAIYAFPSYLHELMGHCEAQQISLPPIPVIFTSSEVLQDSLRARIEQFFAGRVCDIYGSTEFKEVAWQCAQGTYHLNFESVFVEPVTDNESGEASGSVVLLTSLTNRAMPLIRFQIGDKCALSSAPCACGLQSVALTNIGGRSIDMVRLPGDRQISPYLLTTAVEVHDEIARYQIVQTSLDRIELRYVGKTRGLSIDEAAAVRSALHELLGDSMHITMTAVPTIARTAAGKHQVFVQAMGTGA